MLAFAAKLAGLSIFFGAMILTGMAATHRDPAHLSSTEARRITGKAAVSSSTPAANPMAVTTQEIPTLAPATSVPPTAIPPTPVPPTAIAARPTPTSIPGSAPSAAVSAGAFRALRQRATSERDKFAELTLALDQLLAGNPGAIGISVRRVNGDPLFMRNSQEYFPLASVVKLYMLAAYLDRLEQERRAPDADEIELLQAMIEVSDNDSAEEIWSTLGGINAMQAYLNRAGLSGLMPPAVAQLSGGGDPEEPEAWGDASQTASAMSLFLARLYGQTLLSPANTFLATSLLGEIVKEQTWGVHAGVEELDAGAKVLFKNGWYPADEGWRINSAGIVLPGGAREPYVIAIFGQGFNSWSEGLATIEAIAIMINRLMLS